LCVGWHLGKPQLIPRPVVVWEAIPCILESTRESAEITKTINHSEDNTMVTETGPALMIAFDNDGNIEWVEPRGESRIYEPKSSFEDHPGEGIVGTPLKNIDLLYVKAFDILVYNEKDDEGQSVAMRQCVHVRCRRYC